MSYPITGLPRDCETYESGFLRIAAIRAEHVQVFRRDGLDVEAIITFGGKSWAVYEVGFDDIEVQERFVNDASGGYTEIVARIAAGNISPALSAELNRLTDGEYILAIEQPDTLWRILGSPDEPLSFSGTITLDDARPNNNSSQFTWSGKTYQLQPYLTTFDPATSGSAIYANVSTTEISTGVYFILLAGSLDSLGNIITNATPGVTVYIEVRRFGVLLYTANMPIGGNANTDWTYTGGTRSSGQFNTEWETQCTGAGIAFNWNSATLAAIFPDSAVDVTIYLTDALTTSPVQVRTLNLNF